MLKILAKLFRLSYVPLIAPSTSDARIETLGRIADSFIYVVSRMGVTGSSATGTLNAALPELCARVKKHAGANKPIAVGFGVATRDHFTSVSSIADGVVIGSKVINVVMEAPAGKAGAAIEEYCASILYEDPNENSIHKESKKDNTSIQNSSDNTIENGTNGVTPIKKSEDFILPSHFGEFGGQYVPESLFDCLIELEREFIKCKDSPEFWAEYESYYPYMGRPSQLQYADRLTEYAGGAKIWLKREDLNHTGSHKINNALGQVLIAKRLGKTHVIAETGAGQHGVATATACAKLNLSCTVYMGAEDVRRQALNVFRMKILGAKVVAVESGTKTLRDAVMEAMRVWVTQLDTTHYCIGSAIGPHPFPTIVRTFQSVIGRETRQQMQAAKNKLPDAIVACVGGGSNCVGMFSPFIEDKNVRLLGAEAGGDGVETLRHSATLSQGSKGVLHGVRTYLLQDRHGQVQDTHSVSAGLDYPGVGPELASWKDSGRAKFIAIDDTQCFEGFRILSEKEGIIPALESAHAVYAAIELAKTLDADKDIVVSLSGRGDKDVGTVAEMLPELGPKINWDLRF